jgi:segregation and condensation protein B
VTTAVELSRIVEALLFLSPAPVPVRELAEACESSEAQIQSAIDVLSEELADGERGLALKEVGGGFTLATDPSAETAARRLLSKPRTPPLTQAQAECLAIVAYLQPVARPEIARIRGVNSDSPVSTLEDRGLIEEQGRTQFGAILYRTTGLFEKLFGLESLQALPEIQTFAPSAADEQELREKLLRAGEQRVS